jgi:hypothetical protein
MKAQLRVTPRPEFKKQSFIERILRKAPEMVEPLPTKRLYTPIIIDITKIDFSFVDDEGDINIRYTGECEYYALKYSKNLFDAINKAVDEKYPKVTGFVNNSH